MAYTTDDVYNYLVNMKDEINKRLDKIESKGSEIAQGNTKIKI